MLSFVASAYLLGLAWNKGFHDLRKFKATAPFVGLLQKMADLVWVIKQGQLKGPSFEEVLTGAMSYFETNWYQMLAPLPKLS